jgi:hypothetical protein
LYFPEEEFFFDSLLKDWFGNYGAKPIASFASFACLRGFANESRLERIESKAFNPLILFQGLVSKTLFFKPIPFEPWILRWLSRLRLFDRVEISRNQEFFTFST